MIHICRESTKRASGFTLRRTYPPRGWWTMFTGWTLHTNKLTYVSPLVTSLRIFSWIYNSEWDLL